jgi:hypothetical protein
MAVIFDEAKGPQDRFFKAVRQSNARLGSEESRESA